MHYEARAGATWPGLPRALFARVSEEERWPAAVLLIVFQVPATHTQRLHAFHVPRAIYSAASPLPPILCIKLSTSKRDSMFSLA